MTLEEQLTQALANRDNADSDWYKAYVAVGKAKADLNKASADREAAYAEIERIHELIDQGEIK